MAPRRSRIAALWASDEWAATQRIGDFARAGNASDRTEGDAFGRQAKDFSPFGGGELVQAKRAGSFCARRQA